MITIQDLLMEIKSQAITENKLRESLFQAYVNLTNAYEIVYNIPSNEKSARKELFLSIPDLKNTCSPNVWYGKIECYTEPLNKLQANGNETS